jgi:hypothetical protein
MQMALKNVWRNGRSAWEMRRQSFRLSRVQPAIRAADQVGRIPLYDFRQEGPHDDHHHYCL